VCNLMQVTGRFHSAANFTPGKKRGLACQVERTMKVYVCVCMCMYVYVYGCVWMCMDGGYKIFDIHGSVHRNVTMNTTNEMQIYGLIY
jgi:hypothetical protein